MPSESSYKVHRPAKSAASRGGSRRDSSSPDSIIFTPESNLSHHFSSASVSVDRCSSTSDAHDRDDSLVSGLSLERNQKVNTSCSTDLDLDKRGTVWNQTRNSRKSNKVKAAAAWKAEEDDDDNESQNLDSARSSFSIALRECQERRTRSEALAKKLEQSNVTTTTTSTSPRLVTVKRNVFPSPGTTPTYLHTSMQKGWSSERVPLRSNNNNGGGGGGLIPLYSGRTLPSKWEDAERWIVSPLANNNKEGGVAAAARTSFGASHERRPKSKSGPLGPSGFAYSPAVPYGGNMGCLTASSPFSPCVLLPETVSSSRGSTTASSAFPQRIDSCMARSVSMHGCSETLLAPSLLLSSSSSQGIIKDDDDVRAVSRRDMATQMSPEGSIRLSPERQCSFSPSSSPSARPILEILKDHSKRGEVKDLQIDEKVTVTRWSKKQRGLYHGDSSKMRDHLHGKARDTQDLTCAKTEEARIISWENLQKAKAEAAIRKLEMKLEKKRSSSMEKIMRKVKSAEKKAEEMRSGKASSFRRNGKKKKKRNIVSFSGCFTCHVF